MLVCELIAALQKFHPEAKVLIEVAQQHSKRVTVSLETPYDVREGRLRDDKEQRAIIETIRG